MYFLVGPNGEVGRNFVGETERLLLVPKNDYWRICALRQKVDEIDPWSQFHQHSTHSFYVHKLRGQIFGAYILGLYFIGVSLLAQKLGIERW